MKTLGRNLDRLCGEMGLSISTAVNVFARAVVRSRCIPFEITLDVPNAETMEAINEVREAKLDPNKKLYSSFSELLKEVEADV